jgi:hypothetical protein
MALLTGMFADERPLGYIDRAPLLWRDFEKAGYRTLFVEDGFIENHIFDIWVDAMNSPRGFRKIPTDYYFRTLSVAMNDDVEAVSKNRLCVGSTFETKLILDWVSSTFTCLTANTASCACTNSKLRVSPIDLNSLCFKTTVNMYVSMSVNIHAGMLTDCCSACWAYEKKSLLRRSTVGQHVDQQLTDSGRTAG